MHVGTSDVVGTHHSQVDRTSKSRTKKVMGLNGSDFVAAWHHLISFIINYFTELNYKIL